MIRPKDYNCCAIKSAHQFQIFVTFFFLLLCLLSTFFLFEVYFLYFLGSEHRHYWSCFSGSNLWCHPDHSSEPWLQAPCGGEQLTSFTHQEKTPSAQSFFSLSSSTGVKKTTTRLGFRTDAHPPPPPHRHTPTDTHTQGLTYVCLGILLTSDSRRDLYNTLLKILISI